MIILTYYLTQSIGSRGEVTLGERVQLGEAAFVEAPTKTDARDAQQEAFAAVELVAPALAEAGAQRVGQPHRVVVDGAHDEVEEADRAAVRDEEGELDGGGSWGRAEEGVTHRLQQAELGVAMLDRLDRLRGAQALRGERRQLLAREGARQLDCRVTD